MSNRMSKYITRQNVGMHVSWWSELHRSGATAWSVATFLLHHPILGIRPVVPDTVRPDLGVLSQEVGHVLINEVLAFHPTLQCEERKKSKVHRKKSQIITSWWTLRDERLTVDIKPGKFKLSIWWIWWTCRDLFPERAQKKCLKRPQAIHSTKSIQESG